MGMAGETVYVTLSSSDFTNPSVGQVGGNAKFLNYFDREIRFDADGVEVALFSISFKTQQQLGDQSIYIYSNFVDTSVIIGSTRTNLLRRILPKTPGEREEFNPQMLQWQPGAANSFSHAEIEIRDGSGALVPIDTTEGTAITVAIRGKKSSLLY